jgi:hypothetical protein
MRVLVLGYIRPELDYTTRGVFDPSFRSSELEVTLLHVSCRGTHSRYRYRHPGCTEITGPTRVFTFRHGRILQYRFKHFCKWGAVEIPGNAIDSYVCTTIDQCKSELEDHSCVLREHLLILHEDRHCRREITYIRYTTNHTRSGL